jgi:hypothetical protein
MKESSFLDRFQNTPFYISLFKTVELPLLATKETGKVITGNFVLRVEKKKAEMDMEWLIGSKILLSTLRMK